MKIREVCFGRIAASHHHTYSCLRLDPCPPLPHAFCWNTSTTVNGKGFSSLGSQLGICWYSFIGDDLVSRAALWHVTCHAKKQEHEYLFAYVVILQLLSLLNQNHQHLPWCSLWWPHFCHLPKTPFLCRNLWFNKFLVVGVRFQHSFSDGEIV